MPLDFPPSPAVNEIYTFGGRYWIWNGTAWDSYSPVTTITTLNGLTGTVGITAGSGMGVTVSGQNIVLNNTGVLSFNGLTGAVTGVTTGNANTFGPVQSFNGGIVASGATLTGNVYITGLGTPSVDSQAANKAYVDSVASVGIHYHTAVALASTDSETFNTGVTYDNGASGVGATLKKTASFARINIDSTDGSTGDRILIRSAATQQWNGVYSVTNQGSGSTGWILTRTTDADNYHPYENDGLGGNDYFFVTGGSSLKNNAYICSNVGGITFGTTAITFAIFSTPPVYTAGTGLALNSLQFSNTGVLSFNGSTGSITGVSSVRGLTGAVGITNGSGIGLSVSGQTMTFSNTGVLSVNGSTGSVITYAGTTGNIQFRYNNGVTANNYFTLESGDLGEITEVLSLSGPTSSFWYYGNQEAIGLQIKRVYSGWGLDEGGGVQIKVLGIGNDGVDTYASNLRITTPNNTNNGSGIILDAGGNGGFAVEQNSVFSTLIHEFGSGINSYNSASTNTFAGPINAAGATFSSLARFNAGISAAGGTFSGTQTFINGATFTGNISAPNIVNSVRGLTGAVGITNGSGIGLSVSGQTMTFSNTGVLSFNGLTGTVTGVTTGSANTFTALQTFNSGISAAGGVTFAGTVASDTGYRITSNAINAQTGTTYTFLTTDNGKIVTFNNGSAITVTIPTGLPVGFNCTAIQLGAGQVGFTAASGVTMNAYASAYKISGQHGAAALVSYTTNIFNLSGTLSV